MKSKTDDNRANSKGQLQELKDKAEKLACISYLVHLEPPKKDEIAYLAKDLIQVSFPYRNPKKDIWSRKNGNLKLTIEAGVDYHQDKRLDVPYGSIPRILVAWLGTEALKNSRDEKNPNPRKICLGQSLSEFLEKIGINGSTGGKNGSITRFKKQAELLFAARIRLIKENENYSARGYMNISSGEVLFWDTKNPDQQTFFENHILLSEEFYKVLTEKSVPLDWRVLKEIKQSPLALDLYAWLTYRASYLSNPQKIKWETLNQQLGSNTQNIRKFRQEVRNALLKIKAIWQTLQIDAQSSDFILIEPSPPLIEVKNIKGRLKNAMLSGIN